MYNFKNDYSEGAHPDILNKLLQTNLVQQLGYGEDEYSIQAKQVLQRKIANPDAVIYFLSGGTQTNLIVISSLLRVHEAVISAKTGHIFANETGAIEATGHKVIPVDTKDGKLCPTDLEKVLKEYALQPHVVKPKIVFISNATEMGTIYLEDELKALYTFCKAHDLLLYLDGARLGHALTAANNDLSLEKIAKLTDLFYIGATKNGALLGEALIFNKPALSDGFVSAMKQKGALLAKGRVLAIQFLELFKADLYFELAKHANTMAAKMTTCFKELGYGFMTDSTTNQIFPILPKAVMEKLSERYLFYEWKQMDVHHSVIRLITSWATDEVQVDAFIKDVTALSRK